MWYGHFWRKIEMSTVLGTPNQTQSNPASQREGRLRAQLNIGRQNCHPDNSFGAAMGSIGVSR